MHASPDLPPTRSVLAVDDCPATREIMRAVLEHQGFQVQAVDSGDAALAALRQFRFDVIVLDVEMPGMDGPSLARALRSAPDTANAAITMHSSVAEDELRRRFDAYDAYVRKGPDTLALGEQVDRLARSRRRAGQTVPADASTAAQPTLPAWVAHPPVPAAEASTALT